MEEVGGGASLPKDLDRWIARDDGLDTSLKYGLDTSLKYGLSTSLKYGYINFLLSIVFLTPTIPN